MRLSADDRHAIIATAREHFGGNARVWLFGSRIHDEQRGGDLDLLVETTIAQKNRAWAMAQFSAALQLALGEQKIDVVLLEPASPLLPIHTIAKNEGVEITAMPNTNPEELRALTLLELSRREAHWLLRAARRLFALPLDSTWVRRLEEDDAASETLEAFVSRFASLQDTLGDKLLPACLRLLAEKPGSVLDNLNRAEKLGLLWSAQDWLAARNLRNRMVHEYEIAPEQLILSLMAAKSLVPRLVETYNLMNRRLQPILPKQADWPAVFGDEEARE